MIGVITFHFAHNYGAMLQAYALTSCLQEIGYDVEIIDYRPDVIWKPYSFDYHRYNRGKRFIHFCLDMKRRKQASLFQNFVKEYMNCSENIKREELKKSSKDYTAIICGSDQIWNPTITNEDTSYLLDFALPNVRKIGYAVSIGNYDFSETSRHYMSYLASDFFALSFREKKGKDMIEKLIQKKCIEAVDPVFLIEDSKWNNLNERPTGWTDRAYILYYSLSNSSKLDDVLRNIQSETKLPIISVHPMCTPAKVKAFNLRNVGPKQFLWLINHASYIVSDSFHATAFSCIFKKKMFLVLYPGREDRCEQLLKLLDIKYEEGNIIHFERAKREGLDMAIAESKRFLVKALEGVR